MPPLLPRKNVHKAYADRDDTDHQDCGLENNVCHDNASFVVVARAQIDAGNPDFWRQSAVRLRHQGDKMPLSLLTVALHNSPTVAG
jgi:hypothetical protein